MAKHFVFFANTIKRVGGAQLYIKAKGHFLSQQGWMVHIVYHQDGDLIITELNSYHSLICPDLCKPSYMYFAIKRDKIVEKIISFLNIRNQILFESHSRTLASWAEIIAQRIGDVKHICFDLDECISIPRPMANFYKFKYERHELFGIQEQSIDLLFKGLDYKLFYGSPYLKAYGASECISDTPSPLNIKDITGYVIGIVGRLEKNYILEYTKHIKQFVENHRSQQFTVIFVGGAPIGDNIQICITEFLSQCQNLKCIFTGYIFPIPRDLTSTFNVCLAGAGAAYAIRREGIITITIDPRDNKANGILGLTTQNCVFSDGEKHSVTWWLEEVFNFPNKYHLERIEYNYNFSSHIEAINNSSIICDYNTSFLDYNLSFIDQIKRLLNSILPLTQRERLANAIRKLKHQTI